MRVKKLRKIEAVAVVALIIAGTMSGLYINAVNSTKTITTTQTYTENCGTTTSTSFLPLIGTQTVSATTTSFVPLFVTQTITTTQYSDTAPNATTTVYKIATQTVTVTTIPSTNSTCPIFQGAGNPSNCVPITISNTQRTGYSIRPSSTT